MTKRFSRSVATPLILVGAALSALGAAAASDRIALAQNWGTPQGAAATPTASTSCEIAYRQTEIRSWNAYAGRWEINTVDRPHRVCD